MATGITLRFQRDEDDRPQVMYLRDVLLECPVCGRERIERFYDQALFHMLTLARLRALVGEGPDDVAGVCEQCGEALGAEAVARWVVSYGFPARVGLVQAFATPGGVRWALAPYRRFDVQAQPELSVEDDQSIVVLDAVGEADVARVLGRPFSLKASLRAACAALPGTTWVGGLGEGCWALLGDPGAVADARARLDAEHGASDLVWVDLADPIADLLDAPPAAWLPAPALAALRGGICVGLVAASLGAAQRALESCLGQLPGRVPCVREPNDRLRLEFPVGAAGVHTVLLDLRHLVAEALLTGVLPEDRLAWWLDEVITEVASGGESDAGAGDAGEEEP